MDKEKHIVSFSGGKDSTAMLLLMIEKGMQIDEIVCVDTTKEFPEMYDHIEKVKKYIQPYTIATIKIDFNYWFSDHIKQNKDTTGYGWAGSKSRWCTSLKIEALENYINFGYYNPRKRGCKKNKDVNNIIYKGIAYDEYSRLEKNKNQISKYPLVDFKMVEKDCLEYCYSKGFDWGGLYEEFDRVSCYCCPLAPLKYLEHLYNIRPSLWKNMKEMDKKSFRKFRADYTLDQLEDRFKYSCMWREK